MDLEARENIVFRFWEVWRWKVSMMRRMNRERGVLRLLILACFG